MASCPRIFTTQQTTSGTATTTTTMTTTEVRRKEGWTSQAYVPTRHGSGVVLAWALKDTPSLSLPPTPETVTTTSTPRQSSTHRTKMPWSIRLPFITTTLQLSCEPPSTLPIIIYKSTNSSTPRARLRNYLRPEAAIILSNEQQQKKEYLFLSFVL